MEVGYKTCAPMSHCAADLEGDFKSEATIAETKTAYS